MAAPWVDPGRKAGEVIGDLIESHIIALTVKINRIVKAMGEGRATKEQAAHALQYLLANRRQLNDAVIGINSDIAQVVGKEMGQLLGLSSRELKGLGIDFAFAPSDVKAASFAYQNLTIWFETATAQASKEVFAGLLKYANTGSKTGLARMIGEMPQAKYAQYGDTIVHSHLNAFYQQTNNARAERAGVRRWRYMGPAPEREFCKAIFGKVFTIDEINAMDNGQTGNVFITCGGYNCTHRWVPIAPTKADRTASPTTEAEAEETAQRLGVAKSDKNSVFIRSGKTYSSEIKRKVKFDENGNAYYERFTGEKQKVKTDSQGNYYIDAFGASNRASKGKAK